MHFSKTLTSKEIARGGLFTAMAIVAAITVRYGSSVIPFSLLPFVAVLAGGILGSKLAFWAMTLYTFIGLAGIPVFSTEPYGGLAYVLKPSFGFVLGFILAAWGTGFVLEKRKTDSSFAFIGASLIGMCLVYMIGLPYLWAILNLLNRSHVSVWGVVKTGLLPFAAADIIKAVLSGYLAYKVEKRISHL